MKKKGRGSGNLNEQLQTIIDNIKKIEAKHTLKIGVSFSEAQSGESNDKYFSVIINYTHEEELYSAEKEEKENIANISNPNLFKGRAKGGKNRFNTCIGCGLSVFLSKEHTLATINLGNL